MKRFFIITNGQRDEDLSVTHSLQDYISAKGGESSCYVSNKSEWGKRRLAALGKAEIDADCILVLGGDGTLVRAARDTAAFGIPLIGINLGTVGYLCELDLPMVFNAIDSLFEDNYELERRMMIEGSGFGQASTAMNDIVIHRAGNSQLINLVISVNGEYLTTCTADGIIISTPTGSTGYSMSAGGPIVDPRTELLLVTPINPQLLTMRSIVVGADAEIEVTFAKRREEFDEEADVAFDGDHMMSMKVGDTIRVKKSSEAAQILKINRLSFLQILRKKML
ncbi:MAG: NAD(+)/NADH kinase [Clostridiales bacterium]|nr:NAD(+)/NADH kinase [Clostridiales bacterium]